MTSQHDQTGRHDQQNQAGAQGQQGGQPSGGGRGFAGMDRERQREIASQGGRAAHASGNAHQFTSEEARAGPRRGGSAGLVCCKRYSKAWAPLTLCRFRAGLARPGNVRIRKVRASLWGMRVDQTS
jgi:general stress protein YciG